MMHKHSKITPNLKDNSKEYYVLMSLLPCTRMSAPLRQYCTDPTSITTYYLKSVIFEFVLLLRKPDRYLKVPMVLSDIADFA